MKKCNRSCNLCRHLTFYFPNYAFRGKTKLLMYNKSAVHSNKLYILYWTFSFLCYLLHFGNHFQLGACLKPITKPFTALKLLNQNRIRTWGYSPKQTFTSNGSKTCHCRSYEMPNKLEIQERNFKCESYDLLILLFCHTAE